MFFLLLFLFCFFFFVFLYHCFFFLSGAQNFFLGLNFVTISRHISYQKKKINFSIRLGGHPFEAFFFLFSFSFSFFFLFLFLFLGSCSSFLFCFFLKKKRPSFFFSFLAFVSRFNKGCFLRSRCSMEMWCLDDTGRDSWDWVGPLAWERPCFNSREWSAGSSPVKNGASPDCVVVVV